MRNTVLTGKLCPFSRGFIGKGPAYHCVIVRQAQFALSGAKMSNVLQLQPGATEVRPLMPYSIKGTIMSEVLQLMQLQPGATEARPLIPYSMKGAIMSDVLQLIQLQPGTA